jgi:hypothetical protein
MAFGLMKNKWLLLNSPLKVGIDKIGMIVIAIGRLHNFIINERSTEELLYAELHASNYIASTPHAMDGTPMENNDSLYVIFNSHDQQHLRGLSTTREYMVDLVESLGLVRPQHSYKRRKLDNTIDLGNTKND